MESNQDDPISGSESAENPGSEANREAFREQTLAYLKEEMTEGERAAFEEALVHSEELRAELERSRQFLETLEAANEEATVRLVSSFIQQAIRERASDIHFVGDRELTLLVYFRVDGYLREVARLPKEHHQPVIDRIKVMADCSLVERQLPQDGRISARYEGKDYDLRVNITPTARRERAVMRILSMNHVRLGLENLELSQTQAETLGHLLNRPYGMIVTTGPSSSGKTTLLYSLLRQLQQPPRPRPNPLTIEYPVEILLNGVSQTTLRPHLGLTWAAAFRNALRCDPEVVLLAEMRDLETAELAVEQAAGGLFVLTALPFNSALGAIGRLRELGVASFLIAQGLAGLVGQRLVRRVCPQCTTEYTPSPEALRKAGWSVMEDGPFRHGAGCDACSQTGFQGRVGLFEVAAVDDSLRRRIAEGASLEALGSEAFERTGGSLWDDARRKVRQGLTTVEEVTWALFDYPQPQMSLGTKFIIPSVFGDAPNR